MEAQRIINYNGSPGPPHIWVDWEGFYSNLNCVVVGIVGICVSICVGVCI